MGATEQGQGLTPATGSSRPGLARQVNPHVDDSFSGFQRDAVDLSGCAREQSLFFALAR